MLHNLHTAPGSRQKKHRIGRGPGSGWGETAGKGFNGQLARSGGGPRPGFEGGQIPFFQRIPKRGFKNVNHREYAIINVSDLETLFQDGDTVTPEILLSKNIIRKHLDGVKILGNGELTKKLTIKAHHFSASAKAKITASGSTLEELTK